MAKERGLGTVLRVVFAVLAVSFVLGTLIVQPPLWFYPAVFVLIFSFYANTLKERVPLYLTNRTTWAALSHLMTQMMGQEGASPAAGRPAFIDLGCGVGGLLVYLARAKPGWDIVGVETAPGPYLIAKARTAFVPNARVRFQSLWKTDLGPFDIVYAFLSPAPMARLHAKVAAEMRPQSMFVSNSFWADDQPFDGAIEVNDARLTQLFFTKIK